MLGVRVSVPGMAAERNGKRVLLWYAGALYNAHVNFVISYSVQCFDCFPLHPSLYSIIYTGFVIVIVVLSYSIYIYILSETKLESVIA